MGSKPRKKPVSVAASPCGVTRGEITTWEHCECHSCLTKQLRVLEKRIAKAKKAEKL